MVRSILLSQQLIIRGIPKQLSLQLQRSNFEVQNIFILLPLRLFALWFHVLTYNKRDEAIYVEIIPLANNYGQYYHHFWWSNNYFEICFANRFVKRCYGDVRFSFERGGRGRKFGNERNNWYWYDILQQIPDQVF